VAHVLDRVGVVVDAFVGCLAEGVEHDPFRLRRRLTRSRIVRIETPPHFRDAGPALDAEVLGDLFVMGSRRHARRCAALPGLAPHPQFNGPALRAVLEEVGVAYGHAAELGSRLSGEPGEDLFGCLRVAAFRSYAARMSTEGSQAALA